MLIGELAARTGVSAKTLRFYEQAELLHEPARTAGGYRDYDPAAHDRVVFISRVADRGGAGPRVRSSNRTAGCRTRPGCSPSPGWTTAGCRSTWT